MTVVMNWRSVRSRMVEGTKRRTEVKSHHRKTTISRSPIDPSHNTPQTENQSERQRKSRNLTHLHPNLHKSSKRVNLAKQPTPKLKKERETRRKPVQNSANWRDKNQTKRIMSLMKRSLTQRRILMKLKRRRKWRVMPRMMTKNQEKKELRNSHHLTVRITIMRKIQTVAPKQVLRRQNPSILIVQDPLHFQKWLNKWKRFKYLTHSRLPWPPSSSTTISRFPTRKFMKERTSRTVMPNIIRIQKRMMKKGKKGKRMAIIFKSR